MALAVTMCASLALAQNTNSGVIRGTATDASGAVVPGVTVTVLDVDKNVTRTFVTDGAGLFDTGSIVPDHYLLTFTKDGFGTYERGPITLEVGTTTVDGHLKVGATAQKIVVTTDVPLLTTETASQSSTFEAKTLLDLPNVGANWFEVVPLLPGVSTVNLQYNLTPSINGSLPYADYLSDGATSTLPLSENTDVNIEETVQEVKIDTSTFSAQYGMGGEIFNQISKGGTDQFHGAGYEYFYNNALNAAPYSFGQKAHVPISRTNNFGISVGGPIIKKRAFFFFDFDKTYGYGGAANGFITVPTAAMRAGDFTGQPTIYDPTTQTVDANGIVHRQSFAAEYGNGNKIPTAMIDPVANAIDAYYPAANTTGVVVNGQTTNNYFYNVPSTNENTQYFGRLDYNINASNHLLISETSNASPFTVLNQGLCPINCQHAMENRDNAQISDVWTFSPNTINEARMGFADQFNYFIPYSLNEGFPAKLGWQFAKANVFPEISVSGACCYYLQPAANAVGKTFVYDPSDVVTMIRGRHVLHFGGEVLADQANDVPWGNINSGYMQFTGVYTAATQGAANTSGVPFADFLLGQSSGWYAGVRPEWGARQKAPQAFIQDDIKVRPNLTVNIGLRWQGMTGWSEVKGNLRSFDPTVLNTANNTYGAMWYGVTHANGRTALQADVWSTFLPRFGFSYQYRPNTVIRGGVGLYGYPWSVDGYAAAGMGAAFGSSGGLFDSTNGVDDVVKLDSNGNTADQPSGRSINSTYLNAPLTPTAYNGQGVPYNQYHVPVAKSLQWNLDLQRELSRNMVAELAYVASHGYNLAFPLDLNQVPENKLSVNDATGTTNARPYPLYQGIGGATYVAISNYNSMQASVTRRFSSGLQFSANYTWSHMLDTQDSSGGSGAAAAQDAQNFSNPSANYGASNFDVRNAFKEYVIYDLPFGRGQRFLNKNIVLEEVLGGWQVASTTAWTSGSPFTPTMANNTSYSQAGALYPNQTGDPLTGPRNIHEWFNVNAYTAPAPATYGDVHRNSLYGPHYLLANLAIGKTFHVWQNVNMQIRGNAYNFINHPSFSLPDSTIGPGHTAQITGVSVGGRTMMLYGRLSF
ncbi:MAG: outer membrane beta-barrel protein [Acidobacteriaceae bacterium]